MRVQSFHHVGKVVLGTRVHLSLFRLKRLRVAIMCPARYGDDCFTGKVYMQLGFRVSVAVLRHAGGASFTVDGASCDGSGMSHTHTHKHRAHERTWDDAKTRQLSPVNHSSWPVEGSSRRWREFIQRPDTPWRSVCSSIVNKLISFKSLSRTCAKCDIFSECNHAFSACNPAFSACDHCAVFPVPLVKQRIGAAE